MSSPSPSGGTTAPKFCFNSNCKEPRAEIQRKKGWRLRSGEHADLCNRCSCSYEQGTFCDTFHTDVGGWRTCEACGKRVHCGCIVSAPAYMLLDGGGVECVSCAKKGLVMAPKQTWSSPLLLPLQVSERPKEFAFKVRNQISGSFPGQWRQAANLWNVSSAQSEMHQRLAYEFDRPSMSEKLLSGGRSLISAHEKKVEDLPGRIDSSSLNHVTRERYANGTIGLDLVSTVNAYSVDVKADSLRDSGHLIEEIDAMVTRKGLIVDPCSTSSVTNYEVLSKSRVNSVQSSGLKEDSAPPIVGLAAPFSPLNDPAWISASQPNRQTASPPGRQFYPKSHNLIDLSGELQGHMHNGRPRVDARARAQLLPRYWPRLTDQELQQISGNSNSEITPLFEKMLSASDAGRIGRLVLPKKCAEAYFPPISHSEGHPLKVQDATGKEWVFQFRFWPNNNSRMYVLEGVTPCIQSMQLQAGDTVTFSRIDPEGKLLMGYRKASSTPSEQDNQTLPAGNGLVTPPEANDKSITAELVHNLPPRPIKSSTELRNLISTADQEAWSILKKSGFIQKSGAATSLPIPSKKKGSTLGSKTKRLRIDHEDSIELKVTWDAAQDLLRPPNRFPNVVIIEGHEFEEYEEAPVIGIPTFFATNQDGEKSQWAQCEDCLKWRKLPVDALLPSRWICSDNIWDRERSSCSTVQELSMDQLADFLPIRIGTSKRSNKVKVENVGREVSDGLDTLANLAILGEGDELPASTSSQQPTTKHPRHRPGCSCIVCIQAPSGKGPKHKQTCICNVCLTVKRRFRTLMLRREKRQSEKEEAENNALLKEKEQQHPLDDGSDAGSPPQTSKCIDDGVVGDVETEKRKSLASPLKAQIDLNIQPEREEEPSPVANASGMTGPFSNATTKTYTYQTSL